MPKTQADHADLIRRLEAATGPDRELDALIAEALFPISVNRANPQDPVVYRVEHVVLGGEVAEIDVCERVVAYTASLDAAVALVPEGKYWIVGAGKCSTDEPLYGATINELGTLAVIAEGEHNATPALALAIAALRARQGRPEEDEDVSDRRS